MRIHRCSEGKRNARSLPLVNILGINFIPTIAHDFLQISHNLQHIYVHLIKMCVVTLAPIPEYVHSNKIADYTSIKQTRPVTVT